MVTTERPRPCRAIDRRAAKAPSAPLAGASDGAAPGSRALPGARATWAVGSTPLHDRSRSMRDAVRGLRPTRRAPTVREGVRPRLARRRGASYRRREHTTDHERTAFHSAFAWKTVACGFARRATRMKLHAIRCASPGLHDGGHWTPYPLLFRQRVGHGERFSVRARARRAHRCYTDQAAPRCEQNPSNRCASRGHRVCCAP